MNITLLVEEFQLFIEDIVRMGKIDELDKKDLARLMPFDVELELKMSINEKDPILSAVFDREEAKVTIDTASYTYTFGNFTPFMVTFGMLEFEAEKDVLCKNLGVIICQ